MDSESMHSAVVSKHCSDCISVWTLFIQEDKLLQGEAKSIHSFKLCGKNNGIDHLENETHKSLPQGIDLFLWFNSFLLEEVIP